MPQSFSEFLADRDSGQLDADLTARHAEVVKAVRQTGKAGTLTLTVKIEPHGQTVVWSASIKDKAPEPERLSEILFPDDAGELYTDDPAQLKMAFDSVRHVDRRTGEIKVVNFGGSDEPGEEQSGE